MRKAELLLEKKYTLISGVTWTLNATSLLLNLYESELQSLESIKKKKKLWQTISNKLKNHNIEVSKPRIADLMSSKAVKL